MDSAADVGDELLVHRGNGPPRRARVIEVRGEGGRPPYVVRWADGHLSLLFPGSDTTVVQGNGSGPTGVEERSSA